MILEVEIDETTKEDMGYDVKTKNVHGEVTHVRRVLFTLNSFHIVLMNILFTSK